MRLLDLLFDNEYKQRRDLSNLSEVSSATNDDVGQLQSDLAAIRHRLDRTELALEAMSCILQDKGILTADELRTHIVRVDLEDGREDGKIGPNQSADAPTCPTCARPSNPRRRTHCVYCGAPLKPTVPSAPYR